MIYTIISSMITLTISIIQIPNFRSPEKRKRRMAWVICCLFVAATMVAFVIDYNNRKESREESRYAANSGQIDGGRADDKQFYINTSDGGEYIVPHGVFDISMLMPDVKDKVVLKIWFEDGALKVTTDVRDTLGQLIARMNRNEWYVNENLKFDRNFNEEALEVLDNTGQVVFQIQVHGNHVNLKGIFFLPDGSFVALTNFKNDDGTETPIIGLFRNYRPFVTLKKIAINPIFKYPSERHKGEMEQ